MIRIIFFAHYSELYGANRSLLDLIGGLIKENTHVVLILPENGMLEEELKKLDIEYYIEKFETATYKSNLRTELFRPIRIIRRLWQIFALIKKIKLLSPDIIYSNSSVLTVGLVIAKITGIPHILHIREFREDDYDLKFDLGKRISNRLMNWSEKIICVSYDVFEGLPGYLKKKSTVIYNGVYRSEDVPVQVKNLNIKQPVFAIIGYIHEPKGQEDAIKAFRIFATNNNSNSKLYVIGDGNPSYIDYLKQLCFEYNIESKVVFTGFVKNIKPFFDIIDILLVCSKREALGRTTLEAMANGIPVIGNNSGGTTEIIDNNTTGFLYNGTIDDLCLKMVAASTDQAEYSKFSQNSINRFLKNFTQNLYVQRVAGEIKQIVK